MITRSVRQPTLLALLTVLALTAGGATSAQSMFVATRPVSTTDADAPGFRSSPVMFIENAGQWKERAMLLPPSSNRTLPPSKSLERSSVEFVSHVGGSTGPVTVAGNMAYLGTGTSMVILDVRNPASPVERTRIGPYSGVVSTVAVADSRAYVGAGEDGMVILDVSNPLAPVHLGQIEPCDDIVAIEVAGHYAYAACRGAGLSIVDVLSPSHPALVGSLQMTDTVSSLAVSGHFAYLAAGRRLLVIDVSDPGRPSTIGVYESENVISAVEISGNYAFLTDGAFRVVNVTNPALPMLIASLQSFPGVPSMPFSAGNITLSGRNAYVSIWLGEGGVLEIDISNPASPSEPDLARFYKTTYWDYSFGLVEDLATDGRYIYLTDAYRGFRIVDFAGTYPTALSIRNEVTYVGDVSLIGGAPVVADRVSSLHLFDMADPYRPKRVGLYSNDGLNHRRPRALATSGSYAYVHGGGACVAIIDFINPRLPRMVSDYCDVEIFYDIAVVDQRAYIAGYDLTTGRPFQIADLSVPTSPTQLSTIDFPGVPRVAVENERLYLASSGGDIRVYDVANPHVPLEIGSFSSPNTYSVARMIVRNGLAYIAGANGMRIVDLTDPATPAILGEFAVNARDVAVSGDDAFLATSSGLLVLNIADPRNLYAAASLETPGAIRIAMSHDLVYLATGGSGLYILAFSPPSTYTISGRVTEAGGFTGIPGVTVWADTTRSTITDANGNYTFTGLPAGTYNIRPSLTPYAFSPASRAITVPANQTGVNFRKVVIDKVQVNQALGNTTNYVAGKDTVIQVIMSDYVPYDQANQQVVVKRGGVYVTALKPIKPAFPSQTLNFWGQMEDCRLVPRDDCHDWRAGRYTFEATVNGVTSVITDQLFQNRVGFTIRVVPVLTKAGTPTFDWGQMQRLTESVYPLSEDGITWRLWGPLDARDLDLTYDYEGGKKTLEDRLKALQPPGCDVAEGNECPRILGIIHYDPAVGKGWTRTARVAVVADVPEMQTVIAHEIGHDIGFTDRPFSGLGDVYNGGMFQCLINPAPRSYVGRDGRDGPTGKSCIDSTAVAWIPSPLAPNASGATILGTGDNQDWPYEIGGRGILGNKLSFMGHGESQDNFWVTPDVYGYLFDQFAEPMAQVAAFINAEVRVTVVSGWIDRDGSATLQPAYQVAASDPVSSTGAYSIEVLDPQGQLMASQGFDVSFVSLSDPPQDSDNAPFRVAVRLHDGAQKLRIKHDTTVLTEMTISAHAPALSLTSPIAGQTWAATGNYTIRWQGNDLDGDSLYYTVLYRQGAGDRMDLGADLTANELTVDASYLPGGTAAQVQVLATDGINTTAVESGLFTVGRKPPEAFITYPAEGASFMPGASFFLQGTAYDLEDGTLPDPAYRWTSNRDGDLGTGATNLVILSPGPHVITLTVTDSDGNTAVKTIRLSAGDRVFLPLIWRAR